MTSAARFTCPQCGREHDLDSEEGARHLPKLDRADAQRFVEFAGTAATWELARQGLPGVFEGTAQFASDVAVFKRLSEEFFRHQQVFASAANAQQLASELGAHQFADLPQHLQSQMQGAIGEVAHLQQRQESLRYWFNSLTHGNQQLVDGTSFDVLRGEAVAWQTKATLAADPAQEVRKFATEVAHTPSIKVDGKEFASKDITLGINKEALDTEAARHLQNPTEQVGTAGEIHRTSDRLVDKMATGQAHSSLLVSDALAKIGQGAAIGAAFAVGISGYIAYRRYRAGEVTLEQSFAHVGKETAKGAIVGGALSGLTLIVPGGIIGLGVGLVAGRALKNLLDVAFGDGSYRVLVDAEHCVVVTLQQVALSGALLASLAESDRTILAAARRSLSRRRLQDESLDRGMQSLEHKRRLL